MTRKFVRRGGTLMAGAAAVICPVSSYAQSTSLSPQPDQGVPRADAQASADQSATLPTNGLADIVVTAQRRSENLQRAAIAASAVTGGELVNAGVSDVNNLSKLVPSLVVAQSSGSATNFYIRGVGTFAASILRENPIAFNFNGVYVGSPAAPVGTLYDLERVEVLKGPQGTLYGRNATGGSINIIPTRPTLDRIAGSATLEYGNYNSKKATGAFNLPLSETVAVRVAGQVVDRNGYLSDGTDDERGAAGRVSLLFEPNSRFSATLVADYFKQWGKGAGAVLLPSSLTPTAPDPSERVGAGDPRSTAELALRFPALVGTPTGVIVPGNDEYNHGRYWGVSGTIQGDMGFATLTFVPAFRDSRPDYVSYALGYRFADQEDDKQVSGELRLASNGSGPLKYVIGTYLFDEYKVGTNNFLQGPVQNSTYNARLSTESIAAFGQGSYSVLDGLRIVAGVRQTHETKDLDVVITSASFRVPHPIPVDITAHLGFNNTTYKAGLEFDASPSSLLYANVATGFKSGGFIYSVANNTYAPEKLTAYTFGSKNRFLDNRLQANLELFYWNYTDQQINYVGPVQLTPGVVTSGGTTANAGNAKLYGSDLDIRFQLTRHDLFSSQVQYLHSKYDSLSYIQVSANGLAPRTACAITPNFSIAVAAPAKLFSVDCSGKPAINAPKWSINLAYQHQFDLGNDYQLLAEVHSRLESSRYLSIEYLPEEQQGSYTTSDLILTLRAPGGRWSLSGFVNNVESSTVLSSSAGLRPFLNVAYAVLRPPRTYGVRASVNF